MSAFQTDSLNPSALPSSTLGRRRPPAASTSAFDPDPSGTAGPSSDPDAAARARFHEEWNVRIDKEVKALAGGMREIVDLADIGSNPSAHSSAPTSLHLRIRTAQLIRSAQSLRDMSHELRLMLLLSDEVDMARRRDNEVELVKEELGMRRGRVEKEMRELMGGRAGVNVDVGREGRREGGVGERVISANAPDPDLAGEEAGEDIGDGGGTVTGETKVDGPIEDDEDDDDFEEV